MGVYEDLGITPLINAAGFKTRLGGAALPADVIEGMSAAAGATVDIAVLQARASEIIARATGAEAGYVTCGAAAALTLAAAACITRLDVKKIDALPDTHGMPNEIIIYRAHRNSYDHALRAAGGKLIEVGLNDRGVGAGVRSLEAWEVEAAITDRTAAVAYVVTTPEDPPLSIVTEAAHRRAVPVIVDAAAQLPPRENLRRFIAQGADLVAFSGGKGLRGPQASGFLCGRKELVQSVALNHLDFDIDLKLTTPPLDLIPVDRLPGLPHHGIGRGFKVGKEEIIGFLVALKKFAEGADGAEEAKRFRRLAEGIVRDVSRGHTGDLEIAGPPEAPEIHVDFQDAESAASAYRLLAEGNPPVIVSEELLAQGKLVIFVATVREDQAQPLAAAVGRALAARGSRAAGEEGDLRPVRKRSP
jgi:L-seryl-tRNA(Ser) seleniumtransferase